MKQTSLWSGKGAGARFSLFGAALALVCLVGYCIYGAVYDYFDTVVFGGIVLGILFAGLYFLSDTAALGVFNLLSVLCLSAALGLFLLGAGAGPTLLLTALWLCCNLAQETRLCIKNPLRRNPHRRGRAA